MDDAAIEDLHAAVVALHDEIRREGSEFDFRYSLVDHLFTDALGWSRTVGEGHVNVEDDRKDVLCYDDSDPPFPVVVCETKRPAHDLALDDVEQLETYANGVGSADYGILTNGHEVRIYEYDGDDRRLRGVDGFDVEAVARSDVGELSDDQRAGLRELQYLHRSRFVDLGAAEYFRETYQEVPVRHRPGTDDEGYRLFLAAITDSLDALTGVLRRFFDDYRDRDADSFPRQFLEWAFEEWKEWREYTGTSGDERAAFCRETAYVVLNRALFARIAEDKEIVGRTRLSWRGMARSLERDATRPYLDGLMETYDDIDDHYPDLYEVGIFDWWWVSRDERQQFDAGEERRQDALEDDLDHTLGTVLKRLNRFDFEHVNRDILGHVYEDYLPKQERKELGEYYTPLEVVQFMLDSVGYRPSEDIGGKRVLDPACGSGTFLTEVVDRLVDHYVRKFGARSVHGLDPDQARTVFERVEENVYGIDINPFAAHITQINLLFRTIDLYDAVTEWNPDYTMDGFEIHVADTLAPTVMEERSGGVGDGAGQSSLQQFAEYNGRAQSYLEDRDEVDRIKDEAEFDLVVANPPYVRIQNLSGVKEVYGTRYDTAVGNFDVYVPFVERGLEWLSDDGRLAYVCPDRLVVADYARALRDELVEEPITHLVDFKEADVFDVPTPYPCILAVDRERPRAGNRVRCARFAEKGDGALDEIAHLDGWTTPDDARGYELFRYPQDRLAADNEGEPAIWKPMPADERAVFDEIEARCDARLRDVAEAVFQGIITGRDEVFVGEVVADDGDGTVQFAPPESDEPYPVERDVLRRLLKGEEIGRWRTDWSGLWVVFPYEVTDGGATVLAEETLRTDYPGTWAFLEAHEESLKSREGGRWADEDQWWAFSRKQNVEKFERDKILVGVLRTEPSFVPDTEGRYYFVGGGTAGGYGIHLSEEVARSEDDAFFFGGQLNSKLTEFYHEHTSFVFNDKHYSYGQTFLEPLPVVRDFDGKERLVRLAREIRDVSERRTELSYRTADVTNYAREYDAESTVLDLAAAVDLHDDDYRQQPIRTRERTEGGSDGVHQVVLKRGHTLDFDRERVRDFVYELLTARDGRLGRAEILNVPVPERADVLALMDEYEADEDRVEELERDAEELQAELDDVVLREMYDLGDDAVAVVDDFLDVW